MNALTLLYNFENSARLHDKLKNVFIPTGDIEMFLNHAYELVVRKYFETLEKDDKSKTFLGGLIRTRRYDSTEDYSDDTNVENGTYFTLPNDMKYFIMEEVGMINNTTSIVKRPRVEPITDPHYNLNDLNPFKKPYEDMCWRLNYGLNSVGSVAASVQIVIPSGFTLNYYYLTYLKQQDNISFDSNNTPEIDETLHQELISTAIDLAVKAIQVNTEINRK
jgi:hypothetical protein